MRAPDGAIGAPPIDEIITSADRQHAVRLANARETNPADAPVNAPWLVDEGGSLVRSLRRADREE
ncbi:hypothetical protein [Methylobacterium platani]|uniref:hypothetical protein n=1 Tax=Methylobacterium platani TaxID=427683 RepID=UPI000A94D112|nr:hypothetical protein [Methylobacterium platani]